MQLSTDEPVAELGWALKKGKHATRFSDKVRSYLKGIFLQGEETGNKANAANVALKMKFSLSVFWYVDIGSPASPMPYGNFCEPLAAS